MNVIEDTNILYNYYITLIKFKNIFKIYIFRI